MGIYLCYKAKRPGMTNALNEEAVAIEEGIQHSILQQRLPILIDTDSLTRLTS